MLNNVIASLSGGAAPVAATAYESIATVTVGSGGSSGATFSSISSAYTHLQIRMTSLAAGATDNIYLRINGDSTNNYYWHELYGWTGAAAGNSGGLTSYIKIGYTHSLTSGYTGAAVVDILDANNTNKYKTVRALAGSDTNGDGFILFRSGLWSNTPAVSSLYIYPASGTFAQYTSIALYGIKGS